MEKKHKAVVLGVNYYTSLSVIRCLGREGIEVAAVDCSGEGNYVFHSKYITEKIHAPHYETEEAALLAFLVRLAKKQEAKPVLFPTLDPFVEFVDRHLDELRNYYLINQTEQGLSTRLMEKHSLAELAREHGVLIPESIPGNLPNVIETAEKEVGYPSIVKPVDSTAFGRKFHAKVFRIQNRPELEQALEKVKEAGLEVIIQRVIPGFDDHMYTFDAYLNQESKVTHWMTAQKYRQYPINFGASVYTAQKYVPELYDIGASFLEGVGFKGFAEIEFKKDDETGKFYMIEVNVRTTNFNSLIERIGLNMPLLAYKEMTGQPIGEMAVTEDTGKVFWCAYEDIQSVKGYLSTHQLTLSEIARSYHKEKVLAIWAKDDIKPSVAFAGKLADRAAQKFSKKT